MMNRWKNFPMCTRESGSTNSMIRSPVRSRFFVKLFRTRRNPSFLLPSCTRVHQLSPSIYELEYCYVGKRNETATRFKIHRPEKKEDWFISSFRADRSLCKQPYFRWVWWNSWRSRQGQLDYFVIRFLDGSMDTWGFFSFVKKTRLRFVCKFHVRNSCVYRRRRRCHHPNENTRWFKDGIAGFRWPSETNRRSNFNWSRRCELSHDITTRGNYIFVRRNT